MKMANMHFTLSLFSDVLWMRSTRLLAKILFKSGSSLWMLKQSKPRLLSEGHQCTGGAKQVTGKCSVLGYMFVPFDCLSKAYCDTVCPRVFRLV